MNANIERATAIKKRVTDVDSLIGSESYALCKSDACQQAICELEDAILDFKTLVYKTDSHSPLYEEVHDLPGDYSERRKYHLHEVFMRRLYYLLDKYIQYNSQE